MSKQTISVRVESPTFKRVDAIAKKNKRSKGAQVAQWIDEKLAKPSAISANNFPRA